MKAKLMVYGLPALILAAVHFAEAQQTNKVPRIGVIAQGSRSSYAPLNDAFQKGLQELGWNEGKNILIEYRYGEGEPHRIPDLAVNLVRLKVNVIVTSTTAAHQAAKQATATIPIVMAQSGDPVGQGLVSSLARPGANVTGLSSITYNLGGKRLELLKEAVPKISRVAVFGNTASPEGAQQMDEIKIAAQALAIQTQSIAMRGPDDLNSVFPSIAKEHTNALLILRSPLIRIHIKRIMDYAAKSRLPTMCDDTQFVEAGGLMSYGVNILDLYHRAATYVDKILKGSKPADLPVEQPTKFEFAINLKTANQIGVTIPQSVLYRADKVIK